MAKFQELDRAAQSAFDRGQFAVAAEQYGSATCLVPKSARAFYGLGIAEAAAGKFPGCAEGPRNRLRDPSSNVMPLAMLVRVKVAIKDIEQVKEVLRLAAQRFPKDGELHSGLARFLAENQLLDLALAESLRSSRRDRATQASAVALAVLENTVGAYDDAIRHARAIENQAGVPEEVKASAAGVAGLSYENIGEREEAIKHLKLALELAPSQENSYLALAFLYEKARRFKEAVEVLEQGREQSPGLGEFLLPLGNNLVWSEQYQAGIAILKELIRKARNTPEAYMRLAEAYRNTGRAELETQTLQKLARVKPDYPMVGVLTARAMMTLDPVDYPAVLRVLAQAEKSCARPMPDVFYLRGRAYAALGPQSGSHRGVAARDRASSHGSGAVLPAWTNVSESGPGRTGAPGPEPHGAPEVSVVWGRLQAGEPAC